MTETSYLSPGNLDEKDMHPEYRRLEEEYRTKAAQLHERNREVTSMYRADVEAGQEDRERMYIKFYQDDLLPKFDKLASEFVGKVAVQRGRDEKLLTHGQGEGFASHLVAVNSAPPESLGELLDLAGRTNQPALAQAVAQVALSKNQFGVFDRWAESHPERAAALKRLRTMPDIEQLATRANAMKPPIASPESLTPTREDVERARRKEADKNRERQRFFGGPTRRVLGVPLPRR